ncbi:MAG: type III polyketide synthase [Alphaproteobacteria bacterium]|nr:type III polyketide synthase [Alphaproteobacteria bacterium]
MLTVRPRMLAVGTANPPKRYRQEELVELYDCPDPRIRSLYTSAHIRTRHLYLPEPNADGVPQETQGQLLAKHVRGAMEIGPQAVRRCLEGVGLGVQDIDYLCVITTTGFLAPGLSAHLMKEMGFREDCSRVDIVGMGCNAGLNGLNPVASWAMANPGKNALMVCIEVCSAAYVFDMTMRTGIVNSLFGDGAAALLVRADPKDEPRFAPSILAFNSHIIPPALGAMRYDWDDEQHKFSFFLDREIPYVVGANAEKPVERLLSAAGLKRRDIAHWIVHSGGKKVVDAIKYNVGITAWDVRHTSSVLRDFGNLSSGSFLFSYQRLLDEGLVRRGDYGVLMTMGPGSTIETALIRW